MPSCLISLLLGLANMRKCDRCEVAGRLICFLTQASYPKIFSSCMDRRVGPKVDFMRNCAWFDSVPRSWPARGASVGGGAGWGGLGRGVTSDQCKTTCLKLETCQYAIYHKETQSCSGFASCDRLNVELDYSVWRKQSVSLAPQHPPPPPTEAPLAGQDLGTESNQAQFLMKSTFGPTRRSMQELKILGYEAWVKKQMSLPATSHRSHFRMFANPKSNEIKQDGYIHRGVCDSGSRWDNRAFDVTDVGKMVKRLNG